MNSWQMSSRANSLKWDSRGGKAIDAGGEMHKQTYKPAEHFSIHPNGRTDAHRAKQRRHRAKVA